LWPSSGTAATHPCPSCAWVPELDSVLQVGSHQSGVEGQNPLPRPAGHTSLDAAQDMVSLLGCQCTLPAHVQIFIPQPLLILGGCPDPGAGPCTWPC